MKHIQGEVVHQDCYDTPKPGGPVDNPSTREIPVGIAYLDTVGYVSINLDHHGWNTKHNINGEKLKLHT